MTTRTTRRITGGILLGLICIPVLLYLLALAINWRDQPPSPAYAELHGMIDSRPPVADDENAFIYLVGFAAQPADDPRRIGRQWLDALRAKANGNPPEPYKPVVVADGRSAAVKELAAASSAADTKFVQLIEQHPEWLVT